MTIRRARAVDRDALARLAFRSKAHWGYDAAFMERSRDVLTPSEPSFSIEADPNAEGFYLAMGAARTGERVAIGTGRVLPVLRYELTGPRTLEGSPSPRQTS